MGQKVCGMSCAIEWGRKERKQAREKDQRKQDRARKAKLKTTSDWKKEAQASFNAWVRLRDELAGFGCVTCGTTNPKHTGRGGAFDAGHYLSRGAHPEKAFLEDNCHRQCKKCNTFGFSSAAYRNELINRLGLERLEAVEAPTPMTRYRKDDYIAIRDKYRGLLKELKKGLD